MVTFTIAQTKAEEEKSGCRVAAAVARAGRGAEGGQGGAANTPPRTSAGIMALATARSPRSTALAVSACRKSRPRGRRCTRTRGRRRARRARRFGGRGGRGGAELPAAAPAQGAGATETEGQADGASRAKRKDNGNDLIVRNLVTGQDITIQLVSDFALSKDGSWLAYAVSSAKAEADGAFARKMSDGTTVPLLKGKGNYKSLAFDEAGTQLAF